MRKGAMTTIAPTISAPSTLTPTSGGTRDEALWDACVEFEGLLIAQLLRTVHDNLPMEGLIPRSDGERYFQEMLDGEYAKEISRSNPAGIAVMLYQQVRNL